MQEVNSRKYWLVTIYTP